MDSFMNIKQQRCCDILATQLGGVNSIVAVSAQIGHERSMKLPPHPDTAFKILTAAQWAQFEADGVFCGAPVDLADGYIHLSTADQVQGTLDKHFAGQDGLVIAEVSLTDLNEVIKWEASRGGALFPHIYGDLPMSAIAGHLTQIKV